MVRLVIEEGSQRAWGSGTAVAVSFRGSFDHDRVFVGILPGSEVLVRLFRYAVRGIDMEVIPAGGVAGIEGPDLEPAVAGAACTPGTPAAVCAGTVCVLEVVWGGPVCRGQPGPPGVFRRVDPDVVALVGAQVHGKPVAGYPAFQFERLPAGVDCDDSLDQVAVGALIGEDVDGHGVGRRAVGVTVVHPEGEGGVGTAGGARDRGEREAAVVNVCSRYLLVRGDVGAVQGQVPVRG